MSLIDLFKKKPTNWDVFKKFLIADCYIPFNKLNAIETAIGTIMEAVAAGKGKGQPIAVQGVNDDDRFILQMGIAAQLADAKYSTAILDNGDNYAELTEALNQWKPKNCKIGIGENNLCKSKKGKAYVNLFGHPKTLQTGEGILYIFDNTKISTDIEANCINI